MRRLARQAMIDAGYLCYGNSLRELSVIGTISRFLWTAFFIGLFIGAALMGVLK